MNHYSQVRTARERGVLEVSGCQGCPTRLISRILLSPVFQSKSKFLQSTRSASTMQVELLLCYKPTRARFSRRKPVTIRQPIGTNSNKEKMGKTSSRKDLFRLGVTLSIDPFKLVLLDTVKHAISQSHSRHGTRCYTRMTETVDCQGYFTHRRSPSI